MYRSTDSQLKLWTTSQATPMRTFNGHINEKNFVGLATDGDYVACGKCAVYLKEVTNSDSFCDDINIS